MPGAFLGGLCRVPRRRRAWRLSDVGAQSAGAHTGTPGTYYMSVTAHGVAMAYVLSTFFIMGFGYFVAVSALNRPLPGKGWAWGAFVVGVIGVVMALVTIGLGKASVLYTFYPPLTASPCV